MYIIFSLNIFYCLCYKLHACLQGSAIKPKVSPATAIKTLPLPGVFKGDFYQ